MLKLKDHVSTCIFCIPAIRSGVAKFTAMFVKDRMPKEKRLELATNEVKDSTDEHFTQPKVDCNSVPILYTE